MKIPGGAAFHDSIADVWDSRYERVGFKKRLRSFVSLLDQFVEPGQIWLDLGCGSGVLSSELIKRGAQVVAFDGSPSMLAAAKRALCDYGNVVSFQQGDAQNLSWSGSCAFDGVLCSSVVEYVEDPYELIREVGRVLKDDGLLIISIPTKKSLIRSVQKLLRPVIRIFGTDKYSYFDFSRFEIDSSAVTDWLKKVNLQLEHISGFDPLIPKNFHPILPPALLICIGRKFKKA